MKKKIAELELRGDRLVFFHNLGGTKVEIDVTSIWHFFKEVDKYVKQPPTDEEWKVSKEVSDMRDAQIAEMAQEALLEEIESIKEYHEEDSWSVISTHLTINKPKS